MIANTKASLLLKDRVPILPDGFVEMLIWSVPEPLRGSVHAFKYSMAFVVRGECVLRYDNEAGKGDHKHVGDTEVPYMFTTPEQLIEDFWSAVDQWSE